MAVTQRANLPAQFYDYTSSMLLLEPQAFKLHARLLLNAMNMGFSPGGAMGLPGRAFGTNGAEYQDPALGELALGDPLMAEAVETRIDLGNGPGHTVRLNRPVWESTTYSQESREVPAGEEISTEPINISSNQVPVTIKRFAGPFDQANARVAPYGLDRFDSKMALHSFAAMHGAHLKNDFHSFLDFVGVQLLDGNGGRVAASGFDSNTDALNADQFPMTFNLLQRLERAMDDASVPVFSNGRRCIIMRPAQTLQLGTDANFQRNAEYHKEFNPLFGKSYWRTCLSFDIFKSTRLTTVQNAGVDIHYAQAFGPKSIGVAVGEMPRTAFSTEDNFGETAKVIWLMYAAFARLDSRFIYRVPTC